METTPKTLPRILDLASEQDTRDLAAFITPLLRPGDVICLFGNLGAGKTFFANALGHCLGVGESLGSPSFVLLNEYRAPGFPVYHLDLFRLKSEEELLDLGLFDILEGGVTLIEWPELALGLLPGEMLNLSLRFSFDGRRRQVEIVAKGRFAPYFS